MCLAHLPCGAPHGPERAGPQFPRVPASWSPGRVARIAPVLQALAEADRDARELGLDPWELALSVRELYRAGAVARDLRWMVSAGLAVHAAEAAAPGPNRTFHPAPDRSVTEHSCFVLTASGAAAAAQLGARAAHPRFAPPGPPAAPVPHWDPLTRALFWGGEVVKRFRTLARSQELVLAAFEECGWVPRIDDPLPRARGEDPRQRLHDAIRRLNGNQLSAPGLRFFGDGTGEGVCWSG